MTKCKITLVDDEKLMLSGMKMILDHEGDFEVAGIACNGKELLDLVGNVEYQTDIILLDLSMPVLDGIDTLKRLQELEYEAKIIILTSHYNDSIILKLLDEGVSGVLAKNADPDEVIKTIREVHHKDFYINDHILQLIRKRRLVSKKKQIAQVLSKRELEIITLLCQELTTKEIAQQLFISPRTVEGHRNKILEKIGCKNIAGVVVYAIEHNLVEVQISKFT